MGNLSICGFGKQSEDTKGLFSCKAFVKRRARLRYSIHSSHLIFYPYILNDKLPIQELINWQRKCLNHLKTVFFICSLKAGWIKSIRNVGGSFSGDRCARRGQGWWRPTLGNFGRIWNLGTIYTFEVYGSTWNKFVKTAYNKLYLMLLHAAKINLAWYNFLKGLIFHVL